MSQVEVIDPIDEGFRTYLLKLEGGDLAASARTSKAPTGGRLISDVWTDPKHRGRGYSKDIMNVIFRVEPRPLKLRVSSYGDGKKLTNEQLKEYYNRLGFTKPEGDLLVKAAARLLYGRLQTAAGTETWTSRGVDFVERVVAEGVQMDKQADKQAVRLPWQAPVPMGPMNDQPIVQMPWWKARPGEKTLGDVASDVAGAVRRVVQVARNLVPKFPAAPMARGPYMPNRNRVDTVAMSWPAKQSVVRCNSDGMYELVARDGKILGTHANPRKAYGQEYAIRKAEERRAKKASLLQQPQTVDALSQLMEAKRESDRRNYKRKHSILRRLIAGSPQDFEVDSMAKGIAGITHRPTGFRLHMPGKAVPEGLQLSKTSAAVERVPPRKKQRPWWLAPAGTMAAGYGVMRGTDWLVPRQAYEDIKPFADAMVGDPAMPRGQDMSLRQAVDYGDDYLNLGNVAVNARVAGNTTVPDVMHKVRERGSDIAGWIQEHPRVAKALPPAAQTMISGMSEHPITGEGDLRHYREFQAGPLSAYHFSLNEYNPDWGDFNEMVAHFSAKAGIPTVTSGDAAAIRAAVRDYVNMYHRGPDSLDPVEIASLPRERQAELMEGFRKYLMIKDPEMYKREQALSAAIGAHRSTNVAKQYGQGARAGVNIRRAGLVLGGLLMAGGGYMMVRKIQQMRTRKEEERKEEERKKKARPQLRLFPSAQAKAADAGTAAYTNHAGLPEFYRDVVERAEFSGRPATAATRVGVSLVQTPFRPSASIRSTLHGVPFVRGGDTNALSSPVSGCSNFAFVRPEHAGRVFESQLRSYAERGIPVRAADGTVSHAANPTVGQALAYFAQGTNAPTARATARNHVGLLSGWAGSTNAANTPLSRFLGGEVLANSPTEKSNALEKAEAVESMCAVDAGVKSATVKQALTVAEVAEAGKVVPKKLSLRRRASGNYTKGIVTWNGLRISIETPAGHWRIGKKEDGKLWFTKMRDAYGYIQRHEGYDGDAVDVFLGPDLDSPWVHVVNQTDGKSGAFDEVKCVIGCHTEAEARLLYMRNYTKGWKGYRNCVRMSVEQFKKWLPKAKDGPASHSQLKAAAVRGAALQLRGVGAQKLAAFLAPLAISAGGLGTDLITNAYSRRAADRMARALGPMPREEKALLDLQARLRTVPVAGLRSPAYISYRDIENRVGVPLGERKPEEKRRRGMVVYDPKTTPTAYYAHELGHADVPTWARSDRFTPRALTAANVFSYFPGAAYGAWSGRPLTGAAVGALGRLIGRSPVIVEEYFAMRRANQMIDALPGTPEEKQAHKAALMRAFLTYVIPPVASGATVGGAAGLAGMLKGK